MPYKLTFEDGSDGYLAHHGIKGMKWGVWNDETRARRTGVHATRRQQDRQLKKVNKSYEKANKAACRAQMYAANPNLAKAVGVRPDKAQKQAIRAQEKHAKQLAKSSRLGTGLNYDVVSGKYSIRNYADQNVDERKARINSRVEKLSNTTLKNNTKGIASYTTTDGKFGVYGFNDRYASKKAVRKGQRAAEKVASDFAKNKKSDNIKMYSDMGEAYVRTVLEYEYGLKK